jgi:Arc/MetJ family transcription regulator
MMRTTLEIDEKTLAEVQRVTGIHKKSPALAKAVVEYLKESKRKVFLEKVAEGRTEYSTSNKDLEGRDYDDPR